MMFNPILDQNPNNNMFGRNAPTISLHLETIQQYKHVYPHRSWTSVSCDCTGCIKLKLSFNIQ